MVLLGEGRVGKTSLVLRYVKDEFTDNRPPTCEASFLSKRLTVDGQPSNLNNWECCCALATVYEQQCARGLELPGLLMTPCLQATAGQERFHALGPIYYRDADGEEQNGIFASYISLICPLSILEELVNGLLRSMALS